MFTFTIVTGIMIISITYKNYNGLGMETNKLINVITYEF